MVSFSSPTYTVVEGNTTGLPVSITRSGSTDTMVVTLMTADISQGTATGCYIKQSNYCTYTESCLCTAGRDYRLDPVVIVFEEGETEKQVEIFIEDDKNVEVAEKFELYLTGSEGVHLSPFSRAEVTIEDNDGISLCN